MQPKALSTGKSSLAGGAQDLDFTEALNVC